MKSNFIKLGILLLGTATLALISPKAISTIKKHESDKNHDNDKYKAKIEPEKINFC
jgi:hypothetical protein